MSELQWLLDLGLNDWQLWCVIVGVVGLIAAYYLDQIDLWLGWIPRGILKQWRLWSQRRSDHNLEELQKKLYSEKQ